MEKVSNYKRLKLMSRLHFQNDNTYYNYLCMMFNKQLVEIKKCESAYTSHLQVYVIWLYKHGNKNNDLKVNVDRYYFELAQAYVDLQKIMDLQADLEVKRAEFLNDE